MRIAFSSSVHRGYFLFSDPVLTPHIFQIPFTYHASHLLSCTGDCTFSPPLNNFISQYNINDPFLLHALTQCVSYGFCHMHPNPILSNPSLNFLAHVPDLISLLFKPLTTTSLHICKIRSQSFTAKHGTLPLLVCVPNQIGHIFRRKAVYMQ